MKTKRKYHTDPVQKAIIKQRAVEWTRAKLVSDPLFKELHYLRQKRRNQKNVLADGGIIRHPLEKTEARIAEIKALRKAVRPPRISGLQSAEAQERKIARQQAAEIRTRKKKINFLQHEANMELNRLRTQAKNELQTLMSDWRKKWTHIIKKPQPSSKKCRARRNILIRHSKVIGDKALEKQITLIHSGPCKCYWCGTFLLTGGTVDHIVPLAKGGSHTSGNVCAACSPCNSFKREKAPSDVGLEPTLL